MYGRWENMRQLFLSFEGRIRTKDTRRPPHASPWWSRIISCRVADPWIGFWVSAFPEIRFTTTYHLSLLPHRIFSSFYCSLSTLSCLTTYLESRAQHTSRRFPIIFIFCHHFSFDRETTWIFLGKKEKLSFSFPLAFEREFYSDSPLLFHASTDFPHLTVLVYFFLLSLSLARIILPPFGMAPTRQPRRALRLTLDLAF